MAVRDFQIPAITRDQMQEVDRLMVEVYGFQIVQMMENAGRNLAELVKRLTCMLGIEVEPMFIHDNIIKLHDLQGEMLS